MKLVILRVDVKIRYSNTFSISISIQFKIYFYPWGKIHIIPNLNLSANNVLLFGWLNLIFKNGRQKCKQHTTLFFCFFFIVAGWGYLN